MTTVIIVQHNTIPIIIKHVQRNGPGYNSDKLTRQSRQKKIKFAYRCTQTNPTQEQNDGSTILIKNNLQYRPIENFTNETLATELSLQYDSLINGTHYSPRRRLQLPINIINRLLNYNKPAIIIGDFKSKHAMFDDSGIHRNTNWH